MTYPMDNTKPPQVLRVPFKELEQNVPGVHLSQLHFIHIVDENGKTIAQFIRNHDDVIASFNELYELSNEKK